MVKFLAIVAAKIADTLVVKGANKIVAIVAEIFQQNFQVDILLAMRVNETNKISKLCCGKLSV
jgi:hypothetical protein